MIDPEEGAGPLAERQGSPQSAPEELAYRIELWDLSGAAVERVLGRAVSLTLARAIYKAALSEHFGRRLALAHGERILEKTD